MNQKQQKWKKNCEKTPSGPYFDIWILKNPRFYHIYRPVGTLKPKTRKNAQVLRVEQVPRNILWNFEKNLSGTFSYIWVLLLKMLFFVIFGHFRGDFRPKTQFYGFLGVFYGSEMILNTKKYLFRVVEKYFSLNKKYQKITDFHQFWTFLVIFSDFSVIFGGFHLKYWCLWLI